MLRVKADPRVGVVLDNGQELRVNLGLPVRKLMFLLDYAVDWRGWDHIGPIGA